jgi:hypothetical protein
VRKQKDPQQGRAAQRDQQADAHARARHQPRNLRNRLEGLGLREVVAGRVLPGAIDQVAQHHVGHVHQHQADQDFIGIEAVAQQRGDAGPHHAAGHARQQNGQHDPAAGGLVGHQRHAAGKHGTNHKLSFGADVPDVGAEAHRQPQRNDQQRRGLDHQLAHGIRRLDGLPEEHLQAAHRVLAQGREQQHADDHGDHQRQDRRAKAPEL